MFQVTSLFYDIADNDTNDGIHVKSGQHGGRRRTRYQLVSEENLAQTQLNYPYSPKTHSLRQDMNPRRV